EAAVRGAGAAPAASGLPSAARLKELEKALPAGPDNAGMIRELQRLARDAGLQMTKFAPGAQVQGEFTSTLPIAIEVLGGPKELGRYLEDLAGLPRLWVVDRFSFKAVSADDPRSEIRASITARTYFAR
ncbi:MAG TPA: type 4a pilus biogenesis protein PilO, partial [Acidobacteriota bacterium]|nr:type 4a pilus biogenesis protein PilO [Acidobacteriota bacterium]